MMDPVDIRSAKQEMRARVDAALKALPSLTVELASQQACARLETTPEFAHARLILGFAPMPGEIDIWPALAAAVGRGVRLALPRYDRPSRSYTVCVLGQIADVQTGFYGIREPSAECMVLETKLLDLILVPGVAFDTQGRRLGRGKGFYDRLLGSWNGVTCGICFDEQIVTEVPVETHDVHLDCILTPTRFVRTRGLE